MCSGSRGARDAGDRVPDVARGQLSGAFGICDLDRGEDVFVAGVAALLATTGWAGDPQIDAEVARGSTGECRRHALTAGPRSATQRTWWPRGDCWPAVLPTRCGRPAATWSGSSSIRSRSSTARPGLSLLARIEEFLDADPRDPGLARIVIEGRDIVEESLRARTWVDQRASAWIWPAVSGLPAAS